MNHYFEQMILSASPIELIRLLYQRAIASVRDAREHLASRRIMERGRCINQAYMVLTELTISLSTEEAPELSGRLAGLYAYMQHRLLEANMKQQDAPLQEVLGLLNTLAEAWNAVPDSQSEPVEKASPWATGFADESPGIAVSA
jgi:flagellar protein FliS